MLKILQYSFFVLAITLFLQPVIVTAADPAPAASIFVFDDGEFLKGKTGLGNQDPAYIIFNTINTALIFLGTITVVMIIVAGFMWIFAAGAEEKITKAKDLLKGSIFGLVIVLGSYGLAQFVFAAVRIATTGK